MKALLSLPCPNIMKQQNYSLHGILTPSYFVNSIACMVPSVTLYLVSFLYVGRLKIFNIVLNELSRAFRYLMRSSSNNCILYEIFLSESRLLASRSVLTSTNSSPRLFSRQLLTTL